MTTLTRFSNVKRTRGTCAKCADYQACYEYCSYQREIIEKSAANEERPCCNPRPEPPKKDKPQPKYEHVWNRQTRAALSNRKESRHA